MVSKVIRVSKDTWKAIKILQIKLELDTIDDTIKHLIKYYYEKEGETE